MGKRTLLSELKQRIASIGFKLFLWGNDTTEEDYWEEIYQQEKNWRLGTHKEL